MCQMKANTTLSQMKYEPDEVGPGSSGFAPAAVLGHLGAISLKLPNFLTTSQDVTKGADQANSHGHIQKSI